MLLIARRTMRALMQAVTHALDAQQIRCHSALIRISGCTSINDVALMCFLAKRSPKMSFQICGCSTQHPAPSTQHPAHVAQDVSRRRFSCGSWGSSWLREVA